LDEVDEEGTSMSLGILKLVVEPEITAAEKARRLLEQVRSEPREAIRRDMIELIETVVSYKFASMSKEEIEEMLTITESEFKQSRLYQSIEQEGRLEGKMEGKMEGRREGKLETVPELLKLGLSLEQIAQALHLPIEEIEAATQAPLNPEN
jgi:predicted transposase/invertase (TIGR01784 family)